MKIRCKCIHEAQDLLHGKDNRVANKTTHKPTADTVIVSCTVCGNQSKQKDS